jgi:hypothetical protein
VNREPDSPGPGIVVLSSSLQILHINRQAMVLLDRLKHSARSIGAEHAAVAPLHQHCQDIIKTMHTRMGSDNWEQFREDRTIGNSTDPIFVYGFGLPDRRGLPHSRIVMLLSPQASAPTPEATGRESAEGS